MSCAAVHPLRLEHQGPSMGSGYQRICKYEASPCWPCIFSFLDIPKLNRNNMIEHSVLSSGRAFAYMHARALVASQQWTQLSC